MVLDTLDFILSCVCVYFLQTKIQTHHPAHRYDEHSFHTVYCDTYFWTAKIENVLNSDNCYRSFFCPFRRFNFRVFLPKIKYIKYMVTDQMTKSQFVVDVLNRDIRNIYKAQLLIAQHNTRLQGSTFKQKKRAGKKLSERSGRLLEKLRNPDFKIIGTDGKFQAVANIALQTRFLDMKRLGNWMIYNRQVWGILYRNSMLDIKYGYGRQVRDKLGEALDSAFNNAQKK